MNARPRLSVAIIALNEEGHLDQLLPALAWADEVVVVDGGSDDNTRAVAERHGCHCCFRPFDHFAAQRNFALRAAQGDWVLMLDADERPTPAFVREVKDRIRRRAFAGYRTPIRSRIFGRTIRYSGTQDDLPIRLVRRDAATWTGDVHEVCRIDGRVGRFRSPLEHQTLPDVAAFLEKMHRYTRLAALGRVRAGECPRSVEAWVAPPREVFRRLVWKLGLLDGPAGWAFCFLSGLSAWVLVREHRRHWQTQRAVAASARPATRRLQPVGGGA